MLNNFSQDARQVLVFTREEAERLNHNYVGTEHLLLGILRLGEGRATNALRKIGVDFENGRAEVERLVGRGPETKTSGDIPYTPRTKKALELAGKEAKSLGDFSVGAEHLLLGLLGEGEGVAARVLKKLNVDIERVRSELAEGPRATRAPRAPFVVPSTGRRDALIAIVAGLVVLAFIYFGVKQMAQPVTGNKLTGTIIEKVFTPQKERQISFNGRRIEGAKEIAGEFLLKVRVEEEKRTYEVPVEQVVYESKNVGDSMTFLRPPSEQH